MGEVRASIFGNDDDLDLGSFQPTPPARQNEVAAKQAAEKSGFVSREPKAVPVSAPPKSVQRRRRTGRNAQLNIKASPEAITEFYAVADANGWVLGEALEKAIELLRERYGKPMPGAGDLRSR